MTSLPTVLIFTYSEYGQANVNLATSYELALAGVNVYIASFATLRDRVERLQELIARHASGRSSGKPTGSVIFRECSGFTEYTQAAAKHGVTGATNPHPHGVLGALQCYAKLDAMCFPWTPEEYLAAVESIKEIIVSIKPNIAVTDYNFFLARDACQLVGQKFMIMVPNSVKEVGLAEQPNLAMLWKYPAFASGFAFPLKRWQIPLNIYLVIRLTMYVVTAARLRQIEAERKSLGISKPVHSTHPCTYICPALVETDWPYAFIPERMCLCGPIVMPFDPLEESDPALMKWLDNGPTVMINLGSHVVSDGKLAREVASAIRILLDHHDRKQSSDIQVLWKVKAKGDIQKVIDEIIGKEIKEERVKVLPWLEAEPAAILQHPNMVCTVHHGGANSFYEGIWSGVPHIVLPVWLDTYDYANRVEFLNVGLFGNKTCAPGARAEEFGQALVRITGDSKEAAKFRMAAKHLKEVCRAKGNGRELAAVEILQGVGIKN